MMGTNNGVQMTLFLTIALLAMLVVFGVDVRQKRHDFLLKRKKS
jgi:hypothetical protein